MREQAIRFLALLGKRQEDARLRAFPWKKSTRKAEIGARKGGFDLARAARWNADGRGIYLVINNGGDRKQDINQCIAFFVEWDDRPIEWQVTAWQELGLPEPSIIVSTGHSAHTYWVLSEPISPERWRPVQERLIDVCDSDQACKDESRVMRLPGFDYIGEGDAPTGAIEIIHESDNRYTVDQIEAAVAAAEGPTLDDLLAGLDEPSEDQPATEPAKPPRSRKAKGSAGSAGSAADGFPARTMDEIREALACVPQRQSGGNTYTEYRNLLTGLIGAVEEIGGTEAEAIALMESHSPSKQCGWDIAQIAESMNTREPKWFWGICRDHGYKPARRRRERGKSRGAVSADRAPTPPPTEPPADSGPTRWDEFGLLGVDRGTFFYHPREGGQILALSAAAHTATNLLQLAGERWWQDRWPRYNADGEVIGIRWQSVNSDLFRAQYQIGIFDPWRSRGPGVWLDEDRPVIHLGDRIIVDGEVRDVRDGPEGSNYIYDKDYAIEGPGDAKPLSEKDGMGLLVVACSFNWEQESAGMLLVGWLFLAPICGALDWRPHIWLTAAAGSGKTTVLFRFLVKLLGNFALKPVGASTEAGIRQKLASAARPVIFDEAESNEDDDKRRIQRILDLARVSSSRDQGEVLKGTIGGDGMNFAVRSMFLLCSISTALKQNADKTRFTVLTLLRATERLNAAEAADQWKKIDAELKHVATPETGRAMIARACAMVHVIREAAAVFSDACAVQLGNQRLGDQYGTLCAGAWALCNANVPTPEDAAMWLSMYPLTAFAEESKAVTDEGSLRGTLLEHKIKVDLPDRGAQTRTVRELVERIGAGASLGPDDDVVTVKAAIAALGRYGFKVVDSVMVEGGVEMAGALLVSNTAKAIKREILKGTAWQECHPQTLTRAYGAKRVDAAQWFAGLGTHRAVALPLDALDA
jgi:hypothetical protein